MKAEDIIKHFQTSGKSVVFVFEQDPFTLDEIRHFDLGLDTEIAEYRYDAFALKYKIRTLQNGKRLLVLVPGPSPLATGQTPGDFPLLGELMAYGEYKAQTALSFMAAKGLDTGDAQLSAMITRHLSEMTTASAEEVFAGEFGAGFTSEKAAQGLISMHFGAKETLEWKEIFVRLLICDAEELKAPTKGSKSSFLFVKGYGDVLAEVQKKCRWLFGAEGMSPKGAEIGERGFFSGVAERLVYNAVTRPLHPAEGDAYAVLKESDAQRLDRMDGFIRWAVEGLSEKRKIQLFDSLGRLSQHVKVEKIVSVYGAAAEFGFYFAELSAAILRKLAADGFGAAAAKKARVAERVAKSPVIDDNVAALARTEAAMARFYAERAKIGTFALNTREDFVAAYTGGWWRLDREYRLALENFASVNDDSWKAIVETAKEHFETDAQDAFNEMNLAWTERLAEAGGAGGIKGVVAQEEFYEQKKDPSVKMAVVISDGLRYEVALEVMDRLNAERGSVTMEAGIARLPSETKYTKATLLPHASIEFNPGMDIALDGGKPTLLTADKEKILQTHFADGLCLTSDDLKKKSEAERREVFKRKLVYVLHDTIDTKGHGATTGQDVAEICREAVGKLVALIKNIQNSCNVNHVWLVADHGFLVANRDIPDDEKITVEEDKDAVEKTTRYYFTQRRDAVHGIVKMAVSNGWYVAVPAGTRRFKANGSYTFVHGGASLQEMVIPVMHSRLLGSEATKNRAKVDVTILGNILSVQSSRLKFELLQNNAVSADIQERTVRCALYADSGIVSTEVEVKLDSTSGLLDERKKPVELVLNGSAPGLLTLKVFGIEDALNPLAERTVTNNTLIETDNW